MKNTSTGARIIGTGSAIPEKVISNKDLESIVDTTDEWIIRRSGIKERHISSMKRDESTTDMAALAGSRALDMAGVSSGELDMIVVGTVTSDRLFPSTGCMVQRVLKAENAASFDVSAGCSGFIYALATANNAIKTGTCKKALVIGAERLSSIVNWKDRSTCVLLADGAGALVLSADNREPGILTTHLKSDGNLWDLLYSTEGEPYTPDILPPLDTKPFHLIMEGNRLFKRAIECMASVANEAFKQTSLSSDDIGLIIPHQANIRIIRGLAKSLGVSMERVFTNIHKYGNTSSATIPIALDEANPARPTQKGRQRTTGQLRGWPDLGVLHIEVGALTNSH